MFDWCRWNCNVIYHDSNFFAESSTNPSVNHGELMFDWCRWEWEMDGNFGVWDDDFRFDLYSCNISANSMKQVGFMVSFQYPMTIILV